MKLFEPPPLPTSHHSGYATDCHQSHSETGSFFSVMSQLNLKLRGGPKN